MLFDLISLIPQTCVQFHISGIPLCLVVLCSIIHIHLSFGSGYHRAIFRAAVGALCIRTVRLEQTEQTRTGLLQRRSLVLTCAVCHFICIFWLHYREVLVAFGTVQEIILGVSFFVFDGKSPIHIVVCHSNSTFNDVYFN